ncbi:hypothetical protein C6P91_07280 [Burkholderia multivorans]|nr:hypothetical protein C6P91_07280 [Burkholderia multivorans]
MSHRNRAVRGGRDGRRRRDGGAPGGRGGRDAARGRVGRRGAQRPDGSTGVPSTVCRASSTSITGMPSRIG